MTEISKGQYRLIEESLEQVCLHQGRICDFCPLRPKEDFELSGYSRKWVCLKYVIQFLLADHIKTRKA